MRQRSAWSPRRSVRWDLTQAIQLQATGTHRGGPPGFLASASRGWKRTAVVADVARCRCGRLLWARVGWRDDLSHQTATTMRRRICRRLWETGDEPHVDRLTDRTPSRRWWTARLNRSLRSSLLHQHQHHHRRHYHSAFWIIPNTRERCVQFIINVIAIIIIIVYYAKSSTET